jgi:hypothetical protein
MRCGGVGRYVLGDVLAKLWRREGVELHLLECQSLKSFG